MVVTLRWKSNGVGEQSVSHNVKTVGDLCGLARKIETTVRGTAKFVPGAGKATVLSVSVSKE